MMMIRERLRNNFPKTIDKNKPIFSALIANDSGTGTIEKILTELTDYMATWKSSKNIYEQTGDMLEKTTNLITYLTQFNDESETSFKKRINAIFVRGGDTTWGTPYDVKNTFQNYFSSSTIYLIENVDDPNNDLLEDSDFDSETSKFWTFKNAEISKKAPFSKTYGVLFDENGTCSQDVELETSTPYYLHFFHNGNISVQITNSAGEYWTGSAWSSEQAQLDYTSTTWKPSQTFIKTNDNTNLTITFIGSEGTFLDFINLFEYKNYPTFRVIVHNEGFTGKNALALAPGNEDSEAVTGIDYSLAGYYEQSFLTGVSSGFAKDIYEDLLSYIKAIGVKGYLSIVTKDSDLEETNNG